MLKLVPHSFAELVEGYLKQLGHPIVNRDSVWNVYLAVIGMFRANNILTPEEWEDLDPEDELDIQNNHLEAELAPDQRTHPRCDDHSGTVFSSCSIQ